MTGLACLKMLLILCLPRPVPAPIAVYTGQHHREDKPSCHTLVTQRALDRCWESNLGPDAAKADPSTTLMVDFRTCDVIAIFQGDSIEANGLDIKLMISFGGSMYIFYQQRRLVALDRVVRGSPYAYVVIPKSSQPVVVVEGILGNFGTIDRWKHRGIATRAK